MQRIIGATLLLLSICAVGAPTKWTCELVGEGGDRQVTLAVDEQRATLDGEPSTIAASRVLTNRKTFNNGEVRITNLYLSSGYVEIQSAKGGLVASGKCVAGDRPGVAQATSAAPNVRLDNQFTAQPKQETHVEREARAYAEASGKMRQMALSPEVATIIENYWQKRIENADRVDRGQLSPEAATALNESYRQQALAAIQQRQRDTQAQIDAQIQQMATQVQAQQAQQEAARRELLMQQGLRLLNPPRPPPPPLPTTTVCRWIGQDFVCGTR